MVDTGLQGAGRWVIILGLCLLTLGIIPIPPVLMALLGRDRGFLPDTKMFLYLLSGLGLVSGLLCLALCRRVTILLNIALLALTLVIAFVVTEVCLRKFDPQIPQSTQLFERHPTFGWQFIPGITTTVVFPSDHTSEVTISSDGLRDREYPRPKPEGTKRIALLGDSFVAGVDVNPEHVFTEVMEDGLLQGVEVLNFGVNGYGAHQEYMMLRDRVLEFEPDVVWLVFYIRNDFDDLLGRLDWGRGYRRPKASLDDEGNLTITEPVVRTRVYQQSRFSPPSLSKLHVLAFLKNRLGNRSDPDRLPPEVRLCRLDPTADTRSALRLLEATLLESRRLCESNGAAFGVVIAPSVVQVYPETHWNWILETYDLNPTEYDLSTPNEAVERACTRAGVPCFDLTPALAKAAQAGDELFYSGNLHWNRTGHAVVARALVSYLETGHWLKPEAR